MYREGRVEVCVDGRWGTVCGEGWGNTEAGLVCARLGFPAEGKFQLTEVSNSFYLCEYFADATIHQFRGRILVPLYNLTCFSKEKDIPDCTAISIPSLGCSNYSGVKCLTHQEANLVIGMLVATFAANSYLALVIPTEMKIVSSQAVLFHNLKLILLLFPTGSTKGSNNSATTNALGTLAGLLATALVVVTMGWIVSCVYWQRKTTQR